MDRISILDAGGQYTHLIARKVRELGVYSEILPIETPAEKLSASRGVIVSGGPASVYDAGSPQAARGLFDLGVPVLGICYGHQLMAFALQGEVQPSEHREYGMATLEVRHRGAILEGLADREPIWMSHGDLVRKAPPGFQVLAATSACEVAAMGDPLRALYGVQFHPEVSHTPRGQQILSNFAFRICQCEKSWSAGDRIPQLEEQIRETVGERRVFFFVSGGVDSTVAYTLARRALRPERVHGAFIDTGFMRQGEAEEIRSAFAALDCPLEIMDARERFYGAVAGVADPEQKRERIGAAFIEVQDEAICRLGWGDDWVLGQGTIYPDTIESGGTAKAAKIKTHHNRVGKVRELVEQGRVVEPIAELYKDEVRQVARRLELPAALVDRHPFPGPGLAIRCLCSGEEESAQPAPDAGGYHALLLPVRSVGVQGDFRTYARPAMLWGGEAHHDTLAAASAAITNTTRASNRVVYLLASGVPEKQWRWRSRKAAVTAERVATLQDADARVRRWLRHENLYHAMWQFPVVLVPAGPAGGESIVLRPVESTDGMTARYAPLDFAALRRLTPRLLEVPGVEAVLLDVSNKPPATIEWE
jgi:GMP synthase (glutamine-hydrolysing)